MQHIQAAGETGKVQEELLILSNISANQGNLDLAISRCRELLEYTPNDVNLKAKIGRFHSKRGETDEAVGYYKDIAELYLEKSLIAEAMEVIDKILGIDPGNVQYRQKLIEILKNQMRIDEAVDHYSLLVTPFPN